MKSISDLTLLFETELNKLKYSKSLPSLYTPIDYIMNLQGKRIRPSLMLMSFQLFNNDFKKVINPAIAIELFHNFTLVHDDIMDNAPLRRGKETVQKKWNTNTAILSGDTMALLSYQFISKVEKNIVNDVISTFTKAAVIVCEGQQLDLDFETQIDVNISDYIKMIEYKTSVLLAASLKIGAIVGGGGLEDQHNLYEFGKNIGIAFQLRDDLLDVFGEKSSFGKQVGGDILSNKKTYLYLKALEVANKDEKRKLESYYSSDIDNINKIKNVKDIFLDLAIPIYTNDLISKYHIKAIEHLDKVESLNKEPLLNLAEQLLDRNV
tara:strand:- start:8 stop:973 length:966 start_codon:yes stop_codon:yes gene_type:complete